MTERMGRKVGTGSVGTECNGVMGVGTHVGTEGMGVIGDDTLRQCWDGRQ
jgi:hypothetical protein